MISAEMDHKSRLAEIGCALCHHIHGAHDAGPVELHHLRSGGWGKGNYKTLIPLCPDHHRGNAGIHGMGSKAFERGYGITQKELLSWAIRRIYG